MPISTTSDEARRLYLEGREWGDRHRGDLARARFKRAVELDTTFAAAYLQLYRAEQQSEARAWALRKAVELSSQVSEGERLWIMSYYAYENRRLTEAGNCLFKLAEMFPDDPRAHNDYGNHLYWVKDWSGAIDQYLVAISLDPGFAPAYNGLGYCYRFQGNLGAAERFFLRYLELLPDEPNPYDSYADLMTEMNRPQEAIAFYQKALEIDSSYRASYLGIASNYNILGEFAKARHQLKVCIDGPFSRELKHQAMLGLAVSYAYEGRLDEAARSLTEAGEFARAGNDITSLISDLSQLGLVYLEAGLPDEAARVFVQALQAAEESEAASAGSLIPNAQLDHQQRMALVWLVRGELEAAETCARAYADLVKATNDQALIRQSHFTNGLIALAAGNPEMAVIELGQADLTSAFNQYHLAVALERVGNFAQALKYYRQASDFDQLNPLTHAFVHRRADEKVSTMLAMLRSEHGQTSVLRSDSAAALAAEPGVLR